MVCGAGRAASLAGATTAAGNFEADEVRECIEVSVVVAVVATLRVLAEAVAVGWVGGGDFGWLCALGGVSELADTGTAGLCAGVGPELAGNEGAALGEVVALLFWVGGKADKPGGALGVGAGAVLGGGGNGAIPTAALSLAAAAAAAEAYFSVSPGALVGKGAGFMLLFVAPLLVFANGV